MICQPWFRASDVFSVPTCWEQNVDEETCSGAEEGPSSRPAPPDLIQQVVNYHFGRYFYEAEQKLGHVDADSKAADIKTDTVEGGCHTNPRKSNHETRVK